MSSLLNIKIGKESKNGNKMIIGLILFTVSDELSWLFNTLWVSGGKSEMWWDISKALEGWFRQGVLSELI